MVFCRQEDKSPPVTTSVHMVRPPAGVSCTVQCPACIGDVTITVPLTASSSHYWDTCHLGVRTANLQPSRRLTDSDGEAPGDTGAVLWPCHRTWLPAAWLRLKSSPSNLADTVSPVSVITGSQCPAQTASQVQSVQVQVLGWLTTQSPVNRPTPHIARTDNIWNKTLCNWWWWWWSWYILSIFVPLSQSNDIAKKSAFKPKRGHESTTGIHLIDEWS